MHLLISSTGGSPNFALSELHLSLRTLHHIRQGAIPLAGCLYVAKNFVCSELHQIAVNKTQTWYISFPFFFFCF